MTSIYLDNNSTTRILPEVVQEMTACLQKGYLNPASQHGSGRLARKVLEEAREQIGEILGASLDAPHQDQVIITSGGTESNNLAIRGLVQVPGEVLISAIEHPSALAAAEELAKSGCTVKSIPVDRNGHVDPALVEDMVNENTRLVCVMLGNNEIGTLQPVQKLATICSEHQVPLHCDAVQVVGKLSVNFAELGVTTLAFSAHKFHGPRGVAGLILRNRARLQPLLVGGSQQLGLRPGTESVAHIVGMAKALQLFNEARAERAEHMENLRNRLERLLADGTVCVFSGQSPRLPHTTNVAFPGLDRQALVIALDLAGVECSTGSACTSGSSEPSHVLLGMGCSEEIVNSSIRLSISALTTPAEVDLAAKRILSVVNDLRSEN